MEDASERLVQQSASFAVNTEQRRGRLETKNGAAGLVSRVMHCAGDEGQAPAFHLARWSWPVSAVLAGMNGRMVSLYRSATSAWMWRDELHTALGILDVNVSKGEVPDV
jgi:hypothetical protein